MIWVLTLLVVGSNNLIQEWPHRFATEAECMETGRVLASQWQAPPLKAYPDCKEEAR